MKELMIFEGKEVEVLELEGQILFNPYHVGECLELAESSVRNYLAKMNEKQAILLKNSDVRDKDIRKLNNAGEKFLTESGVYKLVFKSHKANAEEFTDWITDEVLPALRKTGFYEMEHSNITYSIESGVLRGVASTGCLIERTMKAQNCKPYEVATVLDTLFKQSGISLPACFVKIPDFEQLTFDCIL